MGLNDFNTNYLNDVLDKASKEQKPIFLLSQSSKLQQSESY